MHQRSGTGLGLYVAAALVRNLGGRLQAESQGPGGGTLMASPSPDTSRAPGCAPAAVLTGTHVRAIRGRAPAGRRGRAAHAAGLKLNFELEGYAVDVARTAREAAGLLAREEPYAAIILDVTLPDRDGFSLCRRLRSAGNLTPVIMLTARSLAQDRVQGLEAGADDYLTKPFDLDELLARVRSMLRRQVWEANRAGAKSTALQFGRARVGFDTHEASWATQRFA